jgi:uncharacterized membrane protein
MTEKKLLGVLVAICMALSLARFALSHSIQMVFLNWNLFLAIVPWLVVYLYLPKANTQSKWLLLPVIGIWLIFFPNAPYILTDLYHLRMKLNMPVWFDVIFILAYAWTGLLFGMLSLFKMEEFMHQQFKTKWTSFFSPVMLLLASFGIYLGRFLRWNSWDLISQPDQIVSDITVRFVHPFLHSRTWGVTFTMFLFLWMVYFTLKFLLQARNSQPNYMMGR